MPIAKPMTDSSQFQFGYFARLVGEEFIIRLGGRRLGACQLVEATPTNRDDKLAETTGQFSLIFVDPNASVDRYLPQSIYQLENQATGTLDLFLVPIGIGKDGTGIQYESVFNSP